MLIFDSASGRVRPFLLFVCISAILISGQTYAADQSNQKPSESTAKPKRSHPHCGLYCLYGAMKLTGQKIEFRELVRPEYIGSRKGSSLVELQKAAEDFGLYAIPAGKLTSRELRRLAYPIILHVKSEIGSEQYDHYELFLGTENNKAKLFNPPELVRLVPFRELAPRWDGNGLIVSAEPIELGAIFELSRKRIIVYVVIALAIILIIHWAKRRLPEALLKSRRKLLGLSVAQGAVFGIAALMFGMLYHFANDEGLLANANATAAIQKAHISNFIPKITERKVRKLLGSDTIFIDARLVRDFEAGHLKGAINVPVDANDVERQKVTANTAKNARIVIYCQSTGCKFAKTVAIKLMADGFSNISVLRAYPNNP